MLTRGPDYLAPTFKLIGNSMVLGSLEVIAEAYTIAEKSGIGKDLVYEYIKGGRGGLDHFTLSRIKFPLAEIKCPFSP
jgi:3-hydroxyisobutyrate dehydrogenase-like beta-hydroxyacid dehydrogenase